MDQFVELPLSNFVLALVPWILIPAAVAAAWAGVTRRSSLAVLFLAVAIVAVVGPMLLLFAEARLRETDDLAGSSWAVVAIDGDPVPAEEMYLFLDGETASLVTHIVVRGGGLAPRCRDSVSVFDMDTDRHALHFTGFEDVPLNARTRASCDESLSELHDRASAALDGTESWAQSEDRVDLTGTNRVVLEKVGRDYD